MRAARLYVAVFGRVPDDKGFDYWVGLDIGIGSMADEFVGSRESRLRYGSVSDAGFGDLI